MKCGLCESGTFCPVHDVATPPAEHVKPRTWTRDEVTRYVEGALDMFLNYLEHERPRVARASVLDEVQGALDHDEENP